MINETELEKDTLFLHKEIHRLVSEMAEKYKEHLLLINIRRKERNTFLIDLSYFSNPIDLSSDTI